MSCVVHNHPTPHDYSLALSYAVNIMYHVLFNKVIKRVRAGSYNLADREQNIWNYFRVSNIIMEV